ncbi:MAG: Ig-like domain-containing protein, partial [Bacteroidales bacterium]
MRKLILFITILVSLQTFAQEGTKQLMPTMNDTLWLEFSVFDKNDFGMYDCDTSERINIYLNAGETMYFGMKMNTYEYNNEIWTDYRYRSFRIMDEAGNEVFTARRIPNSGEGYISNYTQAVTGPNGVILNGNVISGGYNPLYYTATTSGNHYIEFESWWYTYGTAGNEPYRDRWALEFFDVTVTDSDDHVIANPDEPNRSAGRLWSHAWQLCNTSYTRNPVNANFFVVTEDRLINKINFEMTTYSFVFLANKFGITPDTVSANYITRTQSLAGDQIGDKNIAEYPVFLNDPDRTVWPNILLSPPKVQVWAEEELFMDYNYNRNPLYQPLYIDSVILEKNRPNDCDYDDVTFFKIETNLDGYTVVLIDCDGDGEYSTNNNDRVIYRELKKGLNYILWDFKTDAGALVPDGIYNASATFLGRGPSHFPLYDVEQLSGITTSAIRPFNKLNTTIYWDDTRLLDWGDESGTGAMTETQQKQLRVENHVPRTWSFNGNGDDDNNGNLNTMNTWFNAIDLGYTSFGVKVRESATKCVDGSQPYVGDVYMQGPLETDIIFEVEDLDYKFFHTGNLPLSSIRIVSLPTQGVLYNGINPATAGQVITRANIGNLKYDPNPDFHGKDSLLWEAYDGYKWSNNQENIYFVINTDPTITPIDDQRLCTNTPTSPIPFTVNDTNGDALTVTGFSANPEFVPHAGIVINGTGADRTVTVTPVVNKSGRAIIYVMVDDGYSQVIEEFAVVVSPSLEFTGDTIVCTGNDLYLRAEETGATYNWKFEGTTIGTEQTLEQYPVSIGEWSLTVTKTVEGNTCSSTRYFDVSVAPITTYTGDVAVCTGETISLVANEVNASYSWKKNGTQVSTSRTYTKTNASSTDQDTYTLWVSKYGCENTSPAFNITVKNPASTSNIVTGNTVDPGYAGTITVATATNGITYNVYDESDLSTVIASETGSGTNLDISVPHTSLSIGNNIFKVGASNGNCEVMLTDTGKIVVRTPGVTFSTISGNTSEDETTTATFTVNLNTRPSADVTINLSSSDISEGEISSPVSKSLTFTTANYSIAQTVTIIGVNDFIIDGDIDYTINLESVSADGNYNEKSKTVNVTNNDNDVAGVTVNPISGLTTTELLGGTAQFTVVLDCQPNAEVSLTLSSSKSNEGLVTDVSPGRGSATPASNTATITFDNSNWSTPVTVTVTGQDDDIDDNDQPYNIITSLTSCLGDLNFNGLLVDDVQISNSDDDNAGVTVTPTSGLITTEAGGSDSFEIVLTSEPTSDVSIALSSSNLNEGTVLPPSVTFNSSNWSTPQTVTVTGVNDNIDDGDRTYNIITAAATSPDGKYNGINPENVAVTNTDNDNAALIVSPITGLLTTEGGGQATFTVRLATQPVTNITISVTSNDNTEGSVSSSLLTFTNANWNTDQTTTITGVNDNLVDGNVDYTVTLDVTSGDTPYTNLSDIVISAKNNDNDVAGITVTPTTINTSETGTTATFSLVLTSEPKNDVTINFTGVDNTEGSINKPSVTFTAANWNVSQLVTITGLNDAIADGPVEYTIVTIASSADTDYNNISVNDVIVTNADNDIAGITVLPTSGQTTEAGGFLDYTIVLNTQPTANVTISISSSDPSEGTVNFPSVTFTTVNWATPQTIRITGVDDAVQDGNIIYTIVNSNASSTDGTYNGMVVQDVSMSNTDDDVAGLTVSAISGNTTEAGGTATFSVVLTSEPTADVVVSFVTSDGTEGIVSPDSYNFTPANWNTPVRIVTVTGQNDDVVDGNQTYSINIGVSSSDGNYGSSLNTSVSVINLDNDVAGITVSAISGSTSESGGTATFTVKLNTQPVADVLIGFSSSNSVEGIPSPLNYTFNNANWNAPQIVTVTGQDDQVDDGLKTYQINVSVSVSGDDGNYTSALNTQVNVTNIDNDDAGVIITPTSGLETTEAGGTATFTVVLNTRPLAPITINLNTSDNTEGTVSSTSITFTTANWNSPQTVTITGVDDLIDDTDITYSIITAIEPGLDDVYNAINPSDVSVKNIDNDIAGITVNPISGLQTTENGGTAQFTIKLNTQPTAAVRIDLGSSNSTEGIVTPTYYTFTPADWSTAKTVTVTGQNDDVDDDNVVYSIITTMVSGADATYNLINPQDVSVTNIDNDVAGFTVNPLAGLYTHENGTTRTFTVRLNSKPYDDVTLSLISDDISEGKIDKSSLTFAPANWSVNQLVTITGQDDNIDDESKAYTIILSPDLTTLDTNYVDLKPSDVSVTNQDDDAWGFAVTPTSLSLNENGASKTFTVVLSSEPTDTVRIGISSEDISIITVNVDSVKFGPNQWNVPQTITVTAVNNEIDELTDPELNVFTSVVKSSDYNYNGKNLSDVLVTVFDDDAAGITVSEISGTTSELDVLKGTNASFSIVLNSEPTSDVKIQISSSNTGEGTLAPASVTFTSLDWNIAQFITVTGVDDAPADGNITYYVRFDTVMSSDLNYSGYELDSIQVVNVDNDKPGLTVFPYSGRITTEAGGTSTFNVKLNSQPTEDVTISLESSDTGEGIIDKNSLEFTNVNWSTNQTVTITGVDDLINDGDIEYTINITDAASADVGYDTITVFQNIVVVNRDDIGPRAEDDFASTDEDSEVNINVLSNDLGLDDGNLTVSVTANPTHGTVVVDAENKITYNPNGLFNGDDIFTYRVCDNENDCDEATVTVTVTFVNDIPVAIGDRRGTSVNTPRYVDVLFNDYGLEDGGIVISIEQHPNVSEGAVSVVGDSILFTPTADYIGTSEFIYKITDDNGDYDTAIVTINVREVNHEPVANDDNAETTINTDVTISVLANDSGLEDGFGRLQIHTNPTHGTVLVNANRSVTYTPTAGYTGNDSFEYLVADIDGDYDLALVNVNVLPIGDAQPVANDDERGTNFETPRYVDVLVNDDGLNDGGITLTVITAPLQGTAEVKADSILYTPATGFSGTETFTYQVCDADGDCSNTATVTITVNPDGQLNHIPVAANDTVETNVNTPITISVLANDQLIDEFGKLKIFTDPEYGTVVVNTNRTITYTPLNLFVGVDHFIYWVEDIDGDYDTASVTVDVIIKPNSIPVANDDERGTNYQTPRYVDVLVNDKGLNDGGITLSIITAPLQGTAEVKADSILYTPATGFSGTETFTYQVCDADGDCSNTATVTITVKPDGQLNHIPVAANDAVETNMNTPITISVLANDQLIDEFGKLKIFTDPEYGTVVVNTNRTITYTPLNLFVGVDHFTYWVEDIDGDYDTASVTVDVIIKPNSIPVANDDERGTNYQTPKYVDVLFNDKGLYDGGLVLKIITAPVNGTAVVTADSILFTPAALFSGISTFGYSVTDKDGDGDTARVTITVLPEGIENHIPIAVNDTVKTFINIPININVLANDTILDAFGEIKMWVNAKFGTAVVNENRTITYTPSNLFEGIDSLTYYVRDIHGDYDIAAVFVEVSERPNAVPVANDDERGTNYQTDRYVDVLFNDKGLEDGGIILKIIT